MRLLVRRGIKRLLGSQVIVGQGPVIFVVVQTVVAIARLGVINTIRFVACLKKLERLMLHQLFGSTIIVRRLTGVVVVLLRQFVLGFVILEAVLPVAGIKLVAR